MAENISSTLSAEDADRVFLASGYVHPELAAATASELGIVPGNVEHRKHPNSELYARYVDSVRGKHVIIMQTHAATDGGSVNDALQEQLLLIDAARTSSASEITVVCPYLGYSRQDRKARGREPVSARVVINQLGHTGANRIVAVDLHSPQTQAIFSGPFDHLTAQPLLRGAIRTLIDESNKDAYVVAAPDSGSTKMTAYHSERLDVDIVYMKKRRDKGRSGAVSRANRIIPEARDRVCFMFDDMLDTAGTLVSAADNLHDSGAREIYAVATHGVFSGPAFERLADAPINRIYVTDTFPLDDAREALGDRLEVVSVAPMIGRALREIITDGSVSRIFADQNHM